MIYYLYTWLVRHNIIAPCNPFLLHMYFICFSLYLSGNLYNLLVSSFGIGFTWILGEAWRGSSSLRTWGTSMGRTCPYVTYAWRHQHFNSPTKKTLLLGDLGDLFVPHIPHAAKHNQHTPSGPTWRVGPRPRHAGPSPTPELPRHGGSRPRPRREASLPCSPKGFVTSKCDLHPTSETCNMRGASLSIKGTLSLLIKDRTSPSPHLMGL